MMRLLADENIDIPVVEWLRRGGHNVVHISEIAPGADDLAVLNRAKNDNRVVLTSDLDFGYLTFRERQPNPGVILLRLRSANQSELMDRFARAWQTVEQALARDTRLFIVVTDQQIRVRRLPTE